MPKWWKSKRAAWGEILVSLAIGGLSTYLNPIIGIPIFIILLIVGVILLTRAYKSEESNNSYAQKIITDSKASIILRIPDTLREMSVTEATITKSMLDKGIHLDNKTLDSMQTELQHELNIKPNYKYPSIGDVQQRQLVLNEIKHLGLSQHEYNEEHIKILLLVTWLLDKYDRGLTNQLNSDSYLSLKSKLAEQVGKLSSQQANLAIRTFSETSLGINSVMIFYSYFPDSYKHRLSGINKTRNQFEHERDEILNALLVVVKNYIETELKDGR